MLVALASSCLLPYFWRRKTLKTESYFEEKIDKSFQNAAEMLEMMDLPEDTSDEDLELIGESRFHCGTCTVRTVMEAVWPAVEEYIEWLKGDRDEPIQGE